MLTTGRARRRPNNGRKDGPIGKEARHYTLTWLQVDHGEPVAMLFTDDEIAKARARARIQPEDVVPPDPWWRFW